MVEGQGERETATVRASEPRHERPVGSWLTRARASVLMECMGRRQYLAIVRRGGGVDLAQGRGLANDLLALLDGLDAEAATVRADLAAFAAQPIDDDGHRRHRVDAEAWRRTFVDLAAIVAEPPWSLRQKYRSTHGALEGFERIVALAEALTRHHGASELELDEHD